MTRQEKINTEFQRQIDLQNARIDKIDVKLDAFIEEMRDRDNQRAAETAALRAEMAATNEAIRAEMLAKDNQRAAEMAEIRINLQNIQSSGRNTNIMMFLGIAAMVIAVLLK